jgi:hypothetical protein
MLPRGAPLLVAELGFLDRCDDGPVVADWAALESPPAKPQRLHRSSRNPDRRKEVAVRAANYKVATQPVAAQPSADGLNEDSCDSEEKTPSAPAIAPLEEPEPVSPARVHPRTFLPPCHREF